MNAPSTLVVIAVLAGVLALIGVAARMFQRGMWRPQARPGRTLILRESMYGVTRYADFQKVLGCPRNLLAERLQMLVEYGIFAAQPYQEPGERTRQEYLLTEKGARLVPVLQGLLDPRVVRALYATSTKSSRRKTSRK